MAHNFIAKVQKNDMHALRIHWYARPYCCARSPHLTGVLLTIDGRRA
jgi:hypothetical protein